MHDELALWYTHFFGLSSQKIRVKNNILSLNRWKTYANHWFYNMISIIYTHKILHLFI